MLGQERDPRFKRRVYSHAVTRADHKPNPFEHSRVIGRKESREVGELNLHVIERDCLRVQGNLYQPEVTAESEHALRIAQLFLTTTAPTPQQRLSNNGDDLCFRGAEGNAVNGL